MANTETKLTEMTSEGLRESLFEALDDVRSGKLDAKPAHAIAKLAAQIVATVQLEVEFHKNVTRCQTPGALAPSTVLRLGRVDSL